MFDVGIPEFLVLGLVALLVFGPERLPEVAMQAARLIRRLKGMAESAKTELQADLEPHMRELKELRELDPRKMAKRYIVDPVDKDGSLQELRTKNLLGSTTEPTRSPKSTKAKAAVGSASAGAVAGATTNGDEPSVERSNGSAAGSDRPVGDSPTEPTVSSAGPAVPPAMAPAVTSSAERPPYDADAT